MDLFSTVKAHISTIDAAERYGIEVKRNGKALCPFHNDRNPSLFVADDHYHCFACGEHGDSIDLVSKLYDLPLHTAAKKLAANFGLTLDKPPTKDMQKKLRQKNEAQQLRENERLCFLHLNEYCKLLQHWKTEYAPETPDDFDDDRFTEACHNLPMVEYYLDQLIMGNSYERAEVVQMMLRDNGLQRLKAHVETAGREVRSHGR